MDHAIEHDRATKIAWEFVMSTSLIVEALNNRRVLDHSFEPIELPSTASQDGVFRLCAALTPEGQLIAENLKEIQAFVRIIAKRHNLENPEAFSNWIKANHAGVAKPFQKVEGFDTSDEGILLGWTAPICRLFLRSEEKPAYHLVNANSLSHNPYFPQSRSLPSSL
ncbi:hypothetical protein JCM3765_004732 [Sporobolomyces pararoseus]